MPYNSKNTRNLGRYNNPGQFVVSSEQQQPQQQQYQPQQQHEQYQQQQPQSQQSQQSPRPQRVPKQKQQSVLPVQSTDTEVKNEAEMDVSTLSDDSKTVPHWMKTKLPGVKKISNKERRRRQNKNLQRLLTPKNALMVLNEMMPNEQVANQFKVEPANNQYFKAQNMHSFCADLTIEGNSYKGYGENKLMARNAAAEQAIRDLIISRMNKSQENKEATAGVEADVDADADVEMGAGEMSADEVSLPMIQLASFALHKLFTEWEYDGHKVPQLKPGTLTVSEGSEAPSAPAPVPRAPVPRKPKELPLNASAMHPCMLLTYMRPVLEYQELAVEGDRPQNMMFTISVHVDGATYIGKASNKKEARRAAARAACSELFGVVFDSVPTANAPKLTPN